MGQNTGPVIGGIPGGGPVPTDRRAHRFARQPWRHRGSPTATATGIEQQIRDGKPGDKQVAWLETLKSQVLKEGDLAQPREGLLYFPLNGKHKPKQITLLYNGANPRLELTFSDK